MWEPWSLVKYKNATQEKSVCIPTTLFHTDLEFAIAVLTHLQTQHSSVIKHYVFAYIYMENYILNVDVLKILIIHSLLIRTTLKEIQEPTMSRFRLNSYLFCYYLVSKVLLIQLIVNGNH